MKVWERAILHCPLEFIKDFGQYYVAEWHVPVDRTIAFTDSEQSLEPWAQLDVHTLKLTVGPFSSILPSMLQCIPLSFKQLNQIDFGNATIGTVSIKPACHAVWALSMNRLTTL